MEDKNYNRECYKKHREKLLAKSKIYGASHKKEHKEWHKAWAEKHPKEILENKARFRVVHRKITAKSLRLAIEILEKILITIE